MKPSARDRTPSSSSSVASSTGSGLGGLQLLSPTFQQSIEAKRKSSVVKPFAAPRIAGSAGTRVTTAKGAAFDFDSFTLESVRATNKPKDRSDSDVGLSSQAQKLAAAMDAQALSLSDLSSSFHTMRSTEDFDALESRRRNPSTVSSGVSSSTGGAAAVVGAPAVTFKRPTPATELAASRKKTTVLMSGWLQKRKGVVLKRWKAYYCLLRDDDRLCLYASEDTVNGRVEARVQVLRVLLTDKSDCAFHVIGVGTDGSPRKEEFRALHSVDWAAWFRRGFRDYLDAVSLQSVLARQPELLLPDSPRRGRESGSQHDNDEDNQLSHDRRVLSSRYMSNSSGNQQMYGSERQSFGPKQPMTMQRRRESCDNCSETTRSTLSAFSGVSSWTNQSERSDVSTSQQPQPQPQENQETTDCPMLLHDPSDWQQLPILESSATGRSSLESATASLHRSSDVVQPASAFSW